MDYICVIGDMVVYGLYLYCRGDGSLYIIFML